MLTLYPLLYLDNPHYYIPQVIKQAAAKIGAKNKADGGRRYTKTQNKAGPKQHRTM